jgi:hypothetical protein
MKKNLLSLSIAAAVGGLTLAGAAQAGVAYRAPAGSVYSATAGTLTASDANQLDINAGGIGHIVIVPYFSTNAGNTTLLSITNTDITNGKIVKVRFRSALNSDDVFDFQLFLSPADVWTASVSQSGATALSFLNTQDNSCTLPKSVNGDFVTDRLPKTSASVSTDTIAALTREGYIEILNTADVPPNSTKGSLFTNIKHVGGTPPCDPAVFSSLVSTDPATPAEAATRGMDTPSGGLYATSVIVNTANAFVAWPTETTAINAINNAGGLKTTGHANLVFSPQTSDVYAGATPLTALTSDPLLTSGKISALQFDFPDLSTTYVTTPAVGTATDQANTLSGSIAVQSVQNDYSTNPAFSSKTDLNLTFPTRRYGVAVDYTASAGTASPLVFNPGNLYFTDGTAPATGNVTLAGSTGAGRYYACVATGAAVNTSPLVAYDREERGVTQTGFVISPGGTPANLRFCGEVTVTKVNNSTGAGVLSNLIAPTNIDTGYTEGWIRVTTPGLAGRGLPIIGSTYVSAKGNAVAGLSTNFGYSVKNKTVLTTP